MPKPTPSVLDEPDEIENTGHRQPIFVSFRLVTDGKDEVLDRLAVAVECVTQMSAFERRAALAYLNALYPDV